MIARIISCMAVLLIACSCSTGVSVTVAPTPDIGQLEERVYETAPDGEESLLVKPDIRSRDDLLQYREMKRLEGGGRIR